jgi:succinate dehydrogenase / fumarate reductase cytochrome b subunit
MEVIVPARQGSYTASMAMKPVDPKNRPVFLDLRRIRFPVGAIASILHRITGVILVLAIPTALGLIAHSSTSPAHFRQVGRWLEGPLAAVALAVVLGAAVHHLLAGFRILFMDAGIGVRLGAARLSAWAALLIAAASGGAALVWWIAQGGAHVP